jgi:hypothetical protein
VFERTDHVIYTNDGPDYNPSPRGDDDSMSDMGSNEGEEWDRMTPLNMASVVGSRGLASARKGSGSAAPSPRDAYTPRGDDDDDDASQTPLHFILVVDGIPLLCTVCVFDSDDDTVGSGITWGSQSKLGNLHKLEVVAMDPDTDEELPSLVISNKPLLRALADCPDEASRCELLGSCLVLDEVEEGHSLMIDLGAIVFNLQLRGNSLFSVADEDADAESISSSLGPSLGPSSGVPLG